MTYEATHQRIGAMCTTRSANDANDIATETELRRMGGEELMNDPSPYDDFRVHSRHRRAMGGAAVNYSPLKREACPWRYAAEGASETCGGLTAARREMFTAAMWSASPECPQATQEKVS